MISRPGRVRAVLVLVVLCGCAAPRPAHDPAPPPAAFRHAPPDTAELPAADPAAAGWGEIFDDPELDRLLDRLADDNPDYAAARRRMEEAILQAALTRTARYPSLDYAFLAERRKNSGAGSGFNRGETRDTFETPLLLDYTVDLFGRIRAAVDARDEEAAATEADTAGLLLELEAALASVYFGLKAVASEQAVLDQAVAVRAKALELTQARFQAGDVSEIDVSLARTELSEVRSERAGLDRVRIELDHALAALLGTTSTESTRPRGTLGANAPLVAPVVPSTVLRRRPDIRAAERRVAAEAARVGLARRLHFPSFNLFGSAGFEAEDIGDLFGDDSETWRAGGELTGPLFNSGADRIARDIADTRYRRAELAYRSAVIEAVRQCDAAFGAIQALDEQIRALRTTIQSARRTVALTEKQYQAGLVDYFEVVNAQRTALRNEQAEVRTLAERYQVHVRLVQAVGGGW